MLSSFLGFCLFVFLSVIQISRIGSYCISMWREEERNQFFFCCCLICVSLLGKMWSNLVCITSRCFIKWCINIFFHCFSRTGSLNKSIISRQDELQVITIWMKGKIILIHYLHIVGSFLILACNIVYTSLMSLRPSTISKYRKTFVPVSKSWSQKWMSYEMLKQDVRHLLWCVMDCVFQP